MKKPLEHYLFWFSLVPFALWILMFLVYPVAQPHDSQLPGILGDLPDILAEVVLYITPIVIICSAAHCIVAAIRKRFNKRMLIPLVFGFLPILFFVISILAATYIIGDSNLFL